MDELVTYVSKKLIHSSNVKNAEKILIDNGIEPDEAETVLQAIGYALIDVELYPEVAKSKKL